MPPRKRMKFPGSHNFATVSAEPTPLRRAGQGHGAARGGRCHFDYTRALPMPPPDAAHLPAMTDEPTPSDAAGGAPALTVTDLHKRYGAVTAVEGVSFTVGRGEIVGLLGPNGAGKTTTINMILGLLEPSAGKVRIGSIDLRTHRAQALAHTNFAAVYSALPGNLTVRQNLRFFALLYDVTDFAARVAELIEEFDLATLRDSKCGLLSSGEQTRAALAKALLNRPQLLLLDEPTASLDPSAAQIVREKIKTLATTRRCGILWTSHNMQEVEAVCDRVLLLSHGRILLEGDPRSLARLHGAASLEDLFIRVAREPLAARGGSSA